MVSTAIEIEKSTKGLLSLPRIRFHWKTARRVDDAWQFFRAIDLVEEEKAVSLRTLRDSQPKFLGFAQALSESSSDEKGILSDISRKFKGCRCSFVVHAPSKHLTWTFIYSTFSLKLSVSRFVIFLAFVLSQPSS